MARTAPWLAHGASGHGRFGVVCPPPSAPPLPATNVLAALPHDVWENIIACLVGWDLLQLSLAARVFHTDLLADAALWAAHLTQPQQDWQRDVTSVSTADAKRQYAAHRSFRFRGRPVTSSDPRGSDRGACIEALRFLPTASQRNVQLFVPLAPRAFSIDVWFSLQDSDSDRTAGGILLGAQSARWQDAMVWPDYHQQFIHVGPDRELFCSVVGDQRVVTAEPLALRRWYHLAVVFHGDHECVYVDGTLVRRTAGTLGRDWRSLYFMQVGTGCISAGSAGAPTTTGAGWYAFNGTIDELRVWEEPLTPDHITALASDTVMGVKPASTLTSCEPAAFLGPVERVRCSRPRERACVVSTRSE